MLGVPLFKNLASNLKSVFRFETCYLLIRSTIILGQGTPTIFDCLGAIPICTQEYKEVIYPRGEGNFTGEVNSNFSCLSDDNTAVWYTFITDRDGELGFQIKPINEDANFDWGLFNITNADCRDIFFNNAMLVSCNSVNCTGNTGIDNSTAHTSQEENCNLSDPDLAGRQTPWNAFQSVKAGEIYALMISNTSGSTEGYEIDFNISDEVLLIDDVTPKIKLIQADVGIGCIPNKIFINFSENIKCHSISPSNFALRDDRGNRYGVDLDSGSCNLDGEYDRFFVLAILNPLTADRAYILDITPNDNQPIEDLCGNRFSFYSYTFDINTNQLNVINLPRDTFFCGASMMLDVSNPDATSYLWSDSSMNSSLVIKESGTYKVTVSNFCDNVEASIRVTKIDNSNLTLSLGNDTTLCSGESLTLDTKLSIPNLDYLWNDGTTTSKREITKPGTYTIKINDGCGAEVSSSIIVDFLSMNLSLPSDTTLCKDGDLELDIWDPFANDYLWSTGENTSNIIIKEAGLYSVEISNKCESIQSEVNVEEVSCKECIIYIPNVISQGGDLANTEFNVEASCKLESYNLYVYNRWGNLIHSSDDASLTWDGTFSGNKDTGSGVYIYQFDYSYYKDDVLVREQIQGDVLIIN